MVKIKALIENLQSLGFTENESKVYLQLNKLGALTGYEAAKQALIPRPNAYSALQGLVEKGAALKTQGEPSKYIAVDIDQLSYHLEKKTKDSLSFVKKNMPVNQPLCHEPFLTIEGDENILSKISFLLSKAEKTIYLDAWYEEIKVIQDELLAAEKRGVKVVLISVGTIHLPLSKIYDHGREEEWAEEGSRSIHLIIDSEEVLTGEVGQQKSSTVLYSRHSSLIELVKESMVHEIMLLEIKKAFNPQLTEKFGKNLHDLTQSISCLRHKQRLSKERKEKNE